MGEAFANRLLPRTGVCHAYVTLCKGGADDGGEVFIVFDEQDVSGPIL